MFSYKKNYLKLAIRIVDQSNEVMSELTTYFGKRKFDRFITLHWYCNRNVIWSITSHFT